MNARLLLCGKLHGERAGVSKHRLELVLTRPLRRVCFLCALLRSRLDRPNSLLQCPQAARCLFTPVQTAQ